MGRHAPLLLQKMLLGMHTVNLYETATLGRHSKAKIPRPSTTDFTINEFAKTFISLEFL
jgi:hypothetical protein